MKVRNEKKVWEQSIKELAAFNFENWDVKTEKKAWEQKIEDKPKNNSSNEKNDKESKSGVHDITHMLKNDIFEKGELALDVTLVEMLMGLLSHNIICRGHWWCCRCTR